MKTLADINIELSTLTAAEVQDLAGVTSEKVRGRFNMYRGDEFLCQLTRAEFRPWVTRVAAAKIMDEQG